MSDDKPPSLSKLPAISPNRSPVRGAVHLPADGGAWVGTRTTVLKKNANFVREHAAYLDARAVQARSAQTYVDACHELARSIARLDWLPEVLEADYLRGKLERSHEIEMARIAYATAEAEARITLARTDQYLASLRDGPGPAASPQASTQQPAALTPDEVEEIIASLPEASDELRRTISLLLKGRLKEKQG